MSIALSYLLILCCSIIAVICGVLVFHPKYVTGVLRTFGLSVIVIASFSRVVSLLTQPEVEISKVGVMMYIGLAIFFVSHYRGFTGRCRRGGPGWYDPDRTQIIKR